MNVSDNLLGYLVVLISFPSNIEQVVLGYIIPATGNNPWTIIVGMSSWHSD